MAHVTVTIDGKQFRMACDDGQEPHLESLAAHLDEKVKMMRQAFGEIGDHRLTVMAALMISDELFEARRKTAGLQDVAKAFDASRDARADQDLQREAEIAAAIDGITMRVERITDVLTSPRHET
jgi:cell division protein ZapA